MFASNMNASKVNANYTYTTSDARLKINLGPLNSNVCLTNIMTLKPSAFIMDNNVHMGLIAQEVKECIPEAVNLGEGIINGSNVMDFHRLDYSVLNTLTIASVQALYNEIETIKEAFRGLTAELRSKNIIIN